LDFFRRYILNKEEMKKKLAEATDAQAMVQKELCDSMTPVGLQIIQRVFDTAKRHTSNKRQYTPEVKEFSLRVHRASRTAYNYVQRVFPESLPTVTTIRHWMRDSFDNQDPFASAIESVASAQDLLSVLQDESEVDPLGGEKVEGEEDFELVDDSAVEKVEGAEEEDIAQQENAVYYYEAHEEVDAGGQISLQESVGSEEMLPLSMPVLQVVDQSDLAKVQVVWAPPQKPANYSLSEDGMSILINVSQDQDFYKNQESK
jgi:hypothetical protein